MQLTTVTISSFDITGILLIDMSNSGRCHSWLNRRRIQARVTNIRQDGGLYLAVFT